MHKCKQWFFLQLITCSLESPLSIIFAYFLPRIFEDYDDLHSPTHCYRVNNVLSLMVALLFVFWLVVVDRIVDDDAISKH
jgi:hypothetical protein